VKLLQLRPSAPSQDAVREVLICALRWAVARWSSDFVRDSLAARDATGKIRGRLARLRLSSLATESLQAACALVGADAVLVGARLRDRLAASIDDVIAADPEQAPHRVRQLVEQTWPPFFEVFAGEVIAQGDRT
jgi:hypothetical protein